MKKLYILGRFPNKGVTGDDSSDLDSYMELGWELMTTGFWAKNNLDNNSYIATTKDRLFMYSHITKNLIAWEDIEQYHFDQIYHVYKDKFILLEEYNKNLWTENMIENLKKNNFPLSQEKNYVCVQVRRREHCNWRNGNTSKWLQFINELSKKYNKVFVVGQGNDNEKFAENVKNVNIDEYCSLIKSDGCRGSFGNSSGCMILNFIYGRKNLPVYIHYTENIDVHVQNHILYFGNKTNVASVSAKLFFDIDLLIKYFWNIL